MLTVLGIDPGGKGGETGIALIGYDGSTPAHLIDSWAVPGDTLGFYSWWCVNRSVFEEAEHVVCEHFVNRNAPGADLTPCFVEGAVVALSLLSRKREPTLQPASGKNTAVSDAVLRRGGLYTAGGHHRDVLEATRHAVWFLKKMRHQPTLEALWKEK